jgi:hypothetical protein
MGCATTVTRPHKQSGTKESESRRFRVMGYVWATFVTLPFFETFLFNALASSGRRHLGVDDYVRIGLLFLILWSSMCLVFLTEKGHVKKAWSRTKSEFKSAWHKLGEHRSSLIILFLLLTLVYVFVGKQELVALVRGEIKDYVLKGLVLVGIAAFIWVVASILRNLGNSRHSGIREGVENWALSFRVTILFYAFLVSGTFIWVSFQGVNQPMQLEMRLSLVKDYALLFIISNVLYVGLFKLARAKTLLLVFQNVKGFIHFITICGIIAVLAVWADYRELDPSRMEQIFPEEWQRRFFQLHVVVRDIFLLLLPIGCLLVWTFWCIGHEDPESVDQKPTPAA